jgi:hypothetical protein
VRVAGEKLEMAGNISTDGLIQTTKIRVIYSVSNCPKRHAMQFCNAKRLLYFSREPLFVLLPLIFELLDIGLAIPRAEPLCFEAISSIYTVPSMPRADAVAIWLKSTLV